jgi:hypothetical protein
VGFWGSLLVEVLGGVVTAALLAALLAFLNADNQIDAHDREVRALDEDLRRFMRDRDRILKAELGRVTDVMVGPRKHRLSATNSYAPSLFHASTRRSLSSVRTPPSLPGNWSAR